jgi:DNA-binding CsgD family transcriptional regulator
MLPTGNTFLRVADNYMLLYLLLAYTFAIAFMILLPRSVLWVARIAIIVALLTTVIMFLPLNEGVIVVAYCLLICSSNFIIALQACILINLFSKEAAIRSICLVYLLSLGISLFLDLNIATMSLPLFRVFAISIILCWLYFHWSIPANIWPTYARKKDRLVPPHMIFAGIYLIVGLGCVLTLFGVSVAVHLEILAVLFISIMLTSVVLYALWRHGGINPFRTGAVVVSMGTLGFAVLIMSIYIPVLSIPACILIGASIPSTGIGAYFGGVFLMERYPSRFIAPIIVTIALLSLVANYLIAELFADNVHLIYATYLFIAAILATAYFALLPYLVYAMPDKLVATHEEEAETKLTLKPDNFMTYALDKITGQEMRLAELIVQGYSTAEMANIMKLAESTIKSYRKSLYSKLDIHSRWDLLRLAERYQAK